MLLCFDVKVFFQNCVHYQNTFKEASPHHSSFQEEIDDTWKEREIIGMLGSFNRK